MRRITVSLGRILLALSCLLAQLSLSHGFTSLSKHDMLTTTTPTSRLAILLDKCTSTKLIKRNLLVECCSHGGRLSVLRSTPRLRSAAVCRFLQREHLPASGFVPQLFGDGEETCSIAALKKPIRQGWKDFCYGALYVHEQFLDIAWRIFSRVLLVDATLIAVLLLTRWLLPPEMYLQMVVVLEQSMKVLTVPTKIYEDICSLLFLSPLLVAYALVLSIYLVYGFVSVRISAELAKRLAGAGRPLAAQKILWLRQNVLSVPLKPIKVFLKKAFPKMEWLGGMPQVMLASVLLNPLWIVAFMPLLEERQYRFILDRFGRWMASLRASRRKVAPPSLDCEGGATNDRAPKLWFGRYRTWTLVSSLWFASAHISNWYRIEDRKWAALDASLGTLNPTTRLIAASSQFTLALFTWVLIQ